MITYKNKTMIVEHKSGGQSEYNEAEQQEWIDAIDEEIADLQSQRAIYVQQKNLTEKAIVAVER